MKKNNSKDEENELVSHIKNMKGIGSGYSSQMMSQILTKKVSTDKKHQEKVQDAVEPGQSITEGAPDIVAEACERQQISTRREQDSNTRVVKRIELLLDENQSQRILKENELTKDADESQTVFKTIELVEGRKTSCKMQEERNGKDCS